MAWRSMPTEFNSVLDGNDAIPTSHTRRPTQASHIRACINCVRAKAKCSTSITSSEKCERCHRMNKDCHPSPPVRKRRTVTKPSVTKTSKLEEKVDGLVELLKSATQGVPGMINTASANSPPNGITQSSRESASVSMNAGGIDFSDSTYDTAPVGSGFSDSGFTPAASSSSGSPSAKLQPVLPPALEPSPEEAELYLNKFRNNFVEHLPFIVISPSMTAQQLRQDRPLLWVCIMTVASGNSTQQIGLSREVRAIFGREAYIEGTRNMDFLSAILVYAAWDRRYCYQKPLFTSLVQLAIAILYDLGLDKPPSNDPALILAYDLKGTKRPSNLSRSPTMEERRALLVCFLMSSALSHIRKGETLHWTTFSVECLRVLETQKEFASDALLVQLVKLRLISEKVIDAPWLGATVGVHELMRTPAMFKLRSLEAQLHDFKSNIPSELINNRVLLMELHSTELRVHEIGLSQEPDIFSGQFNRRLECLCACLNATKSWVDVFLGIPPAQYVGFSILMYSSTVHCFTGIYRLSTFEHPEWDKELFRQSLDLSLILGEVEKKFAQVKEAAGLDLGGSDDIDSFTLLAFRCRYLKMSWDGSTASATIPLTPTAPTDEMGDFPMALLDDDWMNYLFVP